MPAATMTNRKRYRKQVITPMPSKVTTAVERGQAFRHWLETHNYPIDAFAADSGLGRQTVINLLNGKQDLAAVRQETAEALLTAMNVADVWAWEFFQIPDTQRKSFHTFRPRPLGHGPDHRTLHPQFLEAGLHGHVTAPEGAVAWFEPGVTHGIVLTRAAGRYYALPVDAAQGDILGRLVSVDVSLSPERLRPGRAAPDN